MSPILTDDEIIEMCKEIIDSVTQPTEELYEASVVALQAVLKVASTDFQRMCVHAAYYKLWEPETKTLFCLFE